MWWKAYFFLTKYSQNKSQDIKENYAFKCNNPRHIKELANFEARLIGLIKMIIY